MEAKQSATEGKDSNVSEDSTAEPVSTTGSGGISNAETAETEQSKSEVAKAKQSDEEAAESEQEGSKDADAES